MTAEIVLAFIAGYIMRAWIEAAQRRMRARKLQQGVKGFGEMLAKLSADIQAKKEAAALAAKPEAPVFFAQEDPEKPEPFGYIPANRRPRRRL